MWQRKKWRFAKFPSIHVGIACKIYFLLHFDYLCTAVSSSFKFLHGVCQIMQRLACYWKDDDVCKSEWQSLRFRTLCRQKNWNQGSLKSMMRGENISKFLLAKPAGRELLRLSWKDEKEVEEKEEENTRLSMISQKMHGRISKCSTKRNSTFFRKFINVSKGYQTEIRKSFNQTLSLNVSWDIPQSVAGVIVQ